MGFVVRCFRDLPQLSFSGDLAGIVTLVQSPRLISRNCVTCGRESRDDRKPLEITLRASTHLLEGGNQRVGERALRLRHETAQKTDRCMIDIPVLKLLRFFSGVEVYGSIFVSSSSSLPGRKSFLTGVLSILLRGIV